MLLGIPLFITALVVVGFGALVLGWRGRRIDDHPVCRRCRFDLVGVYPAVGACPECGTVLNEAGRVRYGQRRKRPVLIVSGGFVVMLGAAGGSIYVWAVASGVDLNQHKPVWVLRMEAELGSVARADIALTELLRRSDAKKLSPAQRRRLAESVLQVQADEDSVWNAKWGDLFEAAWLDGIVVHEHTRRYARGSVRFALHPRRTVARGTHLPARLEVRSRVGTRKQLQCHLINYGLRLADDPADPPEVMNKSTILVGPEHWILTGGTTAFIGLAPGGGPRGPTPTLYPPPGDWCSEVVLSEPLATAVRSPGNAAEAHGRIRTAPGEHRARARFIVAVRPADAGAKWVSWRGPAPLENRPNWEMPDWAEVPLHAEGHDLASWRVEVSAPVYVTEAGEPDVELVRDADHAARLATSKTRGLRRDPETGTVWGDLLVPEVTLDLAFEVFARVGDQEILIGPAIIRGRPVRNPDSIALLEAVCHASGATLPEGTTRVDLVARSSRRVAAATMDMKRIWDGELVIRDVPVVPGGRHGGW